MHSFAGLYVVILRSYNIIPALLQSRLVRHLATTTLPRIPLGGKNNKRQYDLFLHQHSKQMINAWCVFVQPEWKCVTENNTYINYKIYIHIYIFFYNDPPSLWRAGSGSVFLSSIRWVRGGSAVPLALLKRGFLPCSLCDYRPRLHQTNTFLSVNLQIATMGRRPARW